MPINFLMPALVNTSLVIAAIAAVVGRKDTCPSSAAHAAYQAMRWGLFGTFAASAVAQAGIVINGLQGMDSNLHLKIFFCPFCLQTKQRGGNAAASAQSALQHFFLLLGFLR